MTLLTPFIILIERRRLPRAIVAAVTSVAMLLSGFGPTVAHAAPAGGQSQGKVARDLDDEAHIPRMLQRNNSQLPRAAV